MASIAKIIIVEIPIVYTNFVMATASDLDFHAAKFTAMLFFSFLNALTIPKAHFAFSFFAK